MNLLIRMNIGARLCLGFGVIIALLLAMTAVGISRIVAVDKNTEVIAHDRLVKVQLAHTIENEVNRQSRALRTALIASDAAVVARELGKVEDSAPIIAKAIERLKSTVHTPQGTAALQTLIAARVVFKSNEHELLGLIRGGKIEEGRAYLVKEMLPPQTAYLAAIDAFTQTQADGIARFADEAAEMAQGAYVLMLALASVATLFALGIGYLLTSSITRPIGKAVDIARAVSAGELGMNFEVRGNDESAQLLHALKAMSATLVGIVASVRDNAESVATASIEIAQGNVDLSQRTEQQLSSLQETSATMEQLSATVRHNADSARQANHLAAGASEIATQGGLVVGQVVATMKGINTSSRKISDIISVIDGIAFQTNILALNAAVEAARAGEEGRGFAVVAAEVRSLAQRSAEAAKEIKSLITSSVEQVERGSVLVDEAGQTMGEIVGAIRRVSDIAGEISSASVQQSAGVSQVGEAVTLMDRATQQNAALVEHSIVATEHLKRQAQHLVQAMSVFHLDARLGATTGAG